MVTFESQLDEFGRLLDSGNQCWFLGAGASASSGIPVMKPLTERVAFQLKEDGKSKVFDEIVGEINDDCNLEHVLNYITDMISLLENKKNQVVNIGSASVSLDELRQLYSDVTREVTNAIRFGYRKKTDSEEEKIGDLTNPIVEIELHRRFVRALFDDLTNRRDGRVGFVTSNYDTLIEDALAIEQRTPLDGFSGSSIGHWIGFEGNFAGTTNKHNVLKLHGSVDWYRDEDERLFRVRYGVRYQASIENTVIFPQSTKYVETQKDPFATVFSFFRRAITSDVEQVLVIVGYSFSDEHINAEIERAIHKIGNKTSVIAFCNERTIEGDDDEKRLYTKLDRWRNSRNGEKVWIATNRSLFHGAKEYPSGRSDLAWGRFEGLINFLEKGKPD